MAYGFDDSKSKVDVYDESEIDTKLSKKQDTITAGTGLAKSGSTLNHKNSVTAETTGKGSATAVPIIKYDAQGHITAVTTATIYPPTSAGTSGQYWKSDGSGVGAWQSMDTAPTANSTNAVTSGAVKSALDGKAASSHTHDDRYYTESEMNTKLGAKQDTMTAGTGIAFDGATINHSNSVTAATTAIGSATKVPCIKYDAQGHITSCTTATIYPPTSAGTSGQIWQSDGSGAGVWQTLDTAPTADSTKAVTSGGVKVALDGKAGTAVATTSANGLMSSGDKSKLDGIATGANKTTVDSALSSTSTNPVQNKVINSALAGKQATMSAGTGIALDGATINHSNSVTAKTSYVGSATAVPMIKYDAQGHITATSTATIYPPTSAGSAGQVWVSDGSGAGAWQDINIPTYTAGDGITIENNVISATGGGSGGGRTVTTLGNLTNLLDLFNNGTIEVGDVITFSMIMSGTKSCQWGSLTVTSVSSSKVICPGSFQYSPDGQTFYPGTGISIESAKITVRYVNTTSCSNATQELTSASFSKLYYISY